MSFQVDRLMELYFKYQVRVQDADFKIEKEKDVKFWWNNVFSFIFEFYFYSAISYRPKTVLILQYKK